MNDGNRGVPLEFDAEPTAAGAEKIHRFDQIPDLLTMDIPPVNWLVLKHGVCMALFQATGDLNAVQDHVGHRSLSSTLVYLRAAGAQKAQKAMESLGI